MVQLTKKILKQTARHMQVMAKTMTFSLKEIKLSSDLVITPWWELYGVSRCKS